MGMDVIGERPKSAKGKYFRNNWWFWRPLWFLTCKVCDGILVDEEKEAGHWNNGWLITKQKAARIADRLEQLLDDENKDELLKLLDFEKVPEKETKKYVDDEEPVWAVFMF